MLYARVRSWLPAMLCCAGLMLTVVAVWPSCGLGEPIDESALRALRGGDTFIGQAGETCDSKNGFGGGCDVPGAPCSKCSVSSGGKLVFDAAGQGWRVIAQFDCGWVQNGICGQNNVCDAWVPTAAKCRDLLLVDQQPIDPDP